MNTAYNNNTTTTVQESRNRYNELLQAALKSINRRKADKTAQESEEVTTPVATPEEVTTTTATDMYHGYLDDKTTLQAGRIKATLDKPVRLDNDGPVLTWLEHIDRLWRAGGLWGYKHLEVSTDYTSTDTKYIARTHWRISTPQSRAEYDGYYTANKTVVEYVKHLLALSGEDVTAGDPTEMEILRYDARLLYLEICKSSAYDEARALIKGCIDKLTAYYTLEGGKSKREIAETIYNDLRPKLRKIASFGIWSVVGVYLDGFVKQATEDATPAPEDTAIEEATPATAPQPTEEDTTTAPEVATAETPVQEPEEVTTEEATELAVEQENDNAPVLLDLIKRYGNVGADYLESINYNQASEQVYSIKRGNSTRVTERYYTIDGRTIYGLYRRYNRNGKRAEFSVYQDGQRIETRAYGKNNNNYKAEIQYNGGEFVYNVTDGKITGGYYTTADKLTIVRFDDNRPETPRDLPAPAPTKTTSKETTKEEPATTKQEQPTSKQAPTPEATTTPEEVKEVTTSKQEDDTTPYWLLLDNELRAQQEEQEQALATPEKSEPEEQAEEPDNEETDDTEEVVFLKGAELDKAIDEYIKKHEYLCDMLDIKYYKSHYYYYITPDGYIVKLDKKKPRRNLYIADEGPFYESYAKGEVTDRSIFFSHNLETLSDFDRDRLDSTACCRVKRTKDGTLSISTYDMRPEYEYDEETKTYKEVPAKKPTTRELAIYVAAWNAYEADQRARLEKYWKRYSDKVCVNTYWADR